MAKTPKSARDEEAKDVFRQFAWNLAGTLVKAPPKPRPSPRGARA